MILEVRVQIPHCLIVALCNVHEECDEKIGIVRNDSCIFSSPSFFWLRPSIDEFRNNTQIKLPLDFV